MPIVTDRASSVVCRSVSLSQYWALQNRLNRSRCRLGCGLEWWAQESIIRWSAPRRHLANTIVPTMCGGDGDFLSNYFDHLLSVCRTPVDVAKYMLLYRTTWRSYGLPTRPVNTGVQNSTRVHGRVRRRFVKLPVIYVGGKLPVTYR